MIEEKNKYLIFFIVLFVATLLVALLPLPALADPGWYNADWTYRKPITIDHDKVNGTQTNFPALINLSSDADLAAKAQSNGNDILFTKDDGTTKLAHEIEEFNSSTGNLIAWINVTSLKGDEDTVLYMYYNNSKCGSQQDATAVWDTNYKGVWHLLGNTTALLPDATSNSNTGTKKAIGEPANTTSGQIDGAQVFDNGTNDYVDCGNDPSLNITDAITIEAWVKATDDPDVIISKIDNIPSGSGWGLITAHNIVPGELDFFIQENGSNYKGWGTNTALNYGKWYHVVATKDSAQNILVYVDGIQQSGNYIQKGTVTDFSNSETVKIGRDTVNSYPFNGTIDEVRISDTARSGDWINTSYNNQVNATPGTGNFIKSLGDEEERPPPVPVPEFNPVGLLAFICISSVVLAVAMLRKRK